MVISFQEDQLDLLGMMPSFQKDDHFGMRQLDCIFLRSFVWNQWTASFQKYDIFGMRPVRLVGPYHSKKISQTFLKGLSHSKKVIFLEPMDSTIPKRSKRYGQPWKYLDQEG
jgi:hypothetical protein